MTNTLRKIFLLFFITLAVVGATHAQSLRAYLKAADNAFATNDYFTALVYYKKVLEVEPDKSNIHFKYAESARLFQAYRIAEDAYHKITLSKDSLNIPLATFWLASVKKNLGKYEEAEQLFTDYLEKFKRVNARFSKRAEKHIVDCRWAATAARSDAKVEVKALAGGINSPYSEFGVAEIDGVLYFSSMKFKDKKNNLYSKLMRRNKDGVIETLDFNKDGKFAANAALSFDGTRLYYTNCDFDPAGNIKCGIYYREKNYFGDWGTEQELPSFINFPGFTTTHPTIGYDKINERELLFFSSNRPGGKGKLDIWYSTFAPNGKLTRPINHAFLNSRENDVTPYFHSPSQTLYFSSDGYPGMGGYDIYKVKRAGRSWQTPRHLGYPVNTSYNDFYYSLNEKGTQAYFASNREEALEIDPENEACCNDIFTAQMKADPVELTKEEYFTAIKEEVPSYVEEEYDEPRVILNGSSTEGEEADLPETILGENNENSEGTQGEVVATNNESTETNNTTMNPKGEDGNTSETVKTENTENSTSENNLPDEQASNTPTNSETVATTVENNSTGGLTFEENTEDLSRDIFPVLFEVVALDMNIEPLNGVTVEFIEKSNDANKRNFRKNNPAGNTFKFRIKNQVNYQLVLSKPGFITDTFAIDQEILLGSTDLSQPFFMSPLPTGTYYPESPLADELEEEAVTEDMLNQYLPIQMYFNNDEPEPASWSNTTNKSYEQTFVLYHSQKDRFKDRYARKFAASQREEVLTQLEDFFEKDLMQGYEDLTNFTGQLLKYLEEGNKVTIGIQAYTTQKATSNKNKALLERRIASIQNQLRNYLGGKLIPFIDAGFLEFNILNPMIVPSQTNGTYSPEASKMRKVEINILTFNNF